jgi:hypothetical protein
MSVQQTKIGSDYIWNHEKEFAVHTVFVLVGSGKLGSGSAIHSILRGSNGS